MRFAFPVQPEIRALYLIALVAANAAAGPDDCGGVFHLRAGAREWSDSPAQAPSRLSCRIDAAPNRRLASLALQQDGVKRSDWRLSINGRPIGALTADEHRQTGVFEIPEGLLRSHDNDVVIESGGRSSAPDDITVEDLRIVPAPPSEWLGAGRVLVRVSGADGKPIPARVTITDDGGTLVATGARSSSDLAVRTGVVYTLSGVAEIPLPAGKHTVWASRGFASSADRRQIEIGPGEERRLEFRLRREVSIPGWTAGDTHLHTFERSGHGDSTVAERAIAIASEGLDWAVNTEHNLAENMPDSSGRFVALAGVELTTRHGHFNMFPWPSGRPLPSPDTPFAALWPQLPPRDELAVIWNHPRDTHGGYRPIDPSHYVDSVAEPLDGRAFGGTAMEVVNSGAMHSDPLVLVADWMRLLNRGNRISAVGSSDSHTVTASLIGQARTYARTGAERPTGAAVAAAFARGETAVSYGLLAFLERRGDRLEASVYGPSWNRVKSLVVFANGERIAVKTLDAGSDGGLQWRGDVEPPPFAHDAWLAVVAVGDEAPPPFWPINRPYQPVSPDWSPMTLGVSPALAWDGNGDGQFQTARELAEQILARGAEPGPLASALARHDKAVAAQTAFLLAVDGRLEDFLAAAGDELPAPIRATLETVGAQHAAATR